MRNGTPGNGHGTQLAVDTAEVRWIEIDLSDVGLPADMPTLDHLAMAAAQVYERFVPYADEGWQWLSYPGSREFDGWLYSEGTRSRTLVGARLLSRRISPEEPATAVRPSPGLSAFRTRQLTGRPWTAEPGSKAWRPFA